MLATRRRPPPLKLDRGRHISTKPNVVISRDASPVAHPIRGRELDQLSPWLLLDRFPTPPSSAPIIQGSKSTVGLSRILRYGGNTEDASVIPSTPKHHRKDRKVQDENVPSTPGLSKKKRHASFGSLGKAFRSSKAFGGLKCECMRANLISFTQPRIHQAHRCPVRHRLVHHSRLPIHRFDRAH